MKSKNLRFFGSENLKGFLKKKIFLIGIILAILILPILASATTYYVDSSIGSDSNSCTAAEDTATPKRTVSGVMSCNPGAGDIVKFRGTFTQTIYPARSGEVLYAFQV